MFAQYAGMCFIWLSSAMGIYSLS